MKLSDFISGYTLQKGYNPKVMESIIMSDRFFVKEGSVAPGATIPGTTLTPSYTLYEYQEPKRSNIVQLANSL